MSAIKAVLFDFDGTIADTDQIIIDSWQEVFRAVEGAERPIGDILATLGEPLHDSMRKLFAERADECIKIYRDFQFSIYMDAIKLYAGMEELIRQLKNDGFSLAVVTSRLAASTYSALEKYELSEVFDTIVTCDDTDKHKPDPEPALIALERLGVEPMYAVMVGDSRYDMECGKNAGVKTALVGWSSTFKESSRCEPDYVIHKAEDLKRLLEDIC